MEGAFFVPSTSEPQGRPQNDALWKVRFGFRLRTLEKARLGFRPLAPGARILGQSLGPLRLVRNTG